MQTLRTSSRLLRGVGSRRYLSQSSTRGRSVIVTGAAQGIGRAISLQLAADGYDVCVNDVESKKQALEEVSHSISTVHKRKTVPITADVASPDAMEALIAASVNHLGPLNTMVSNAGIVRTAPVLETTPEDHEKLFAVNYFGVYNSHRAAALQFLKQGLPSPDHPPVLRSQSPGEPKTSKGVYKLIAAASTAALRPGPLISAYSATKSAVRGLSQGFAQELGHAGITANCYAPGVVGTRMWEQLDSDVSEITGREKGTIMRQTAGMAVLGRVSVPEDVSGTVSWLASPQSDFVTGQCVVVDGGLVFT